MPGTGDRAEGRHWWLFAVVLSAFALAAIAPAILSDLPSKAPASALNSRLVLYLEQSALCAVLLLVAVTVLGWALKGKLPVKFGKGGVEYDAQIASNEAIADRIDQVVTRLENIESSVSVALRGSIETPQSSTTLPAARPPVGANEGGEAGA